MDHHIHAHFLGIMVEAKGSGSPHSHMLLGNCGRGLGLTHSPTFLKNCDTGERIGIAACLETVFGGKKWHAPCEIFSLSQIIFLCQSNFIELRIL